MKLDYRLLNFGDLVTITSNAAHLVVLKEHAVFSNSHAVIKTQQEMYVKRIKIA